MSALREAAQQALEALELAQTDVHWELNSPTRKFLRKAEKNLRAALAEPVQEPVAWSHINGTSDTKWHPPQRPVELVQEPVASIYITPNGAREFDDWRHDLPVGSNLLYTSPPQRKPLTEEEIEQINRDLPLLHMQARKGSVAVVFARAIERAHGITP